MEHKIGTRILIKEDKSRVKINLKPSKNILIGGFQIVMMFAFGYLCYTGTLGLVNNKLDIFSVGNLIMILFTTLTLIGTINRLISFYDIFYSEEEIEVSNQIIRIRKKRLLKSKMIEVNLSDMQSLKIEENHSKTDSSVRIDFTKWTNFFLLKDNQKIRFFETANYHDLEKVKRFLKEKKIIKNP